MVVFPQMAKHRKHRRILAKVVTDGNKEKQPGFSALRLGAGIPQHWLAWGLLTP